MFRLIAQNPAALRGFRANHAALTKMLDVKTWERIALAVAEVKGCDDYLGLNLAARALHQRRHQPVRDAGGGGGEIVEIVAVTAENVFTNLLKLVAESDMDFPAVRASNT